MALCSIVRPKKAWYTYKKADQPDTLPYMWFEGAVKGFLDRYKNGRKSSIGYYDPMFRNLLERVKKMHPELFATGGFIGDFRLRRSPLRGATTEAENKNVENAAIEIINRWRKREAARGKEVGLSIRQV